MQLGGLIKTMPITAISFLFCVFSVMGIPPFGGFFSKYMVMTSTIKAGDLWIMFVFLLGAFLTIIYLLRVFNLVFLGEAKTQPVREGSAGMVFSVAALAVLSLVAGFCVAWPSQFVLSAIQHLPGVIR
jgi:formate hydrogenlyase subunit 3/multisubunit Na+/H+ antiporter MnhD subunit